MKNPRWQESEMNVLIMDEAKSSKRELEQLYQEAEEYDFLLNRTPQALPDYWEAQD